MTDVSTIVGWLEKIGYEVTKEGETMLRLVRRGGPEHPPFFVQCAENWLMLSMLPLTRAGEYKHDQLGLRLLGANREMRVAKFAIDAEGCVVLCAELPTESLDYSELEEAADRMLRYSRSLSADLRS